MSYKPMLSKQTPSIRSFKYNPFSGAMLYVFSRDNNPAKTIILNIKEDTSNNSKEFYIGFCLNHGTAYLVKMRRDGGQVSVFLVGGDGVPHSVENYSVKFYGKQQKKMFARA